MTDDEFNIMKTHSFLGAKAIEQAEKDSDKTADFLNIAKEISHWHHERWDGKGYPDGLAGEDIPLSARLMSLADVFDALISKRVYKEAFSFHKAREIIAAERGRQFDPDITDAFLACFEQFVSIAQKYQLQSH
jgi:putative two-component system response regulator